MKKIDKLNLYSVEELKNTEERRKINEIIEVLNAELIKCPSVALEVFECDCDHHTNYVCAQCKENK